VGNVLGAQGDLLRALAYYKEALAIADRLAKADSGNAKWQRSLSVAYSKVGDVLIAQGDMAGALVLYKYELAITERLAKADPGNAELQYGLAATCARLA
jgi:phage tail protein X